MKLNRTNVLLLKMKSLRSIYFAMCDSFLTCSCIVCTQNLNDTVNRLIIFQKKALRIINFKDQLYDSSPLFSENSILKFGDNFVLEYIFYVNKSINRQVSPVFRIGLHFQKIFIDAAFSGLWMTISTFQLFQPKSMIALV